MIFSEDSFLPGSVVERDIIGAIEAKQTSEEETVRNDRIILMPALPIEKDKEIGLGDFSKHKIQEPEDFFAYYNKMEGKQFTSLGVLSARETWVMLKQQFSRYEV